MVYTRGEAADRSLEQTRNVPGTCQLVTRTWFGAASAGDFDGDGDADAVDGWKSEPEIAKHRGDRKPPRGTPVAWSGGRNGYGHRAISLGHNAAGVYYIRSTDAGGVGVVATVPLSWVEEHWGLHYEGWSSTIDGEQIPIEPHHAATPSKPEPKTRGDKVDEALAALRDAKGKGPRRELIEEAIDALKKISYLRVKP